MRVQFVVQKKSGISYHRLINPMEFMTFDEGDHAEMLWITEDEHLIDGDILYYNKFIFTDAAQLEKLKKRGVKIVVDVDDSWDLPISHPFYESWQQRGNTQRAIDNIRLADLVICTTLLLQEKVRALNKNTIVIPNAFPFGHDVYKPMSVEGREKMGFIYVAGSTHLQDVKLLEGKFERIGGDPFLKNNAEFILAGYEPTLIKRYETREDQKRNNQNFKMVSYHDVWDKMVTILSKTKSYSILPSTDLDSYINYYDQADVALIPLCPTEWNSYKSELKIIEAACKGLPVICSNVLPYSNLSGYDGIMWVNKPSDWIDHIRYCVKNPNYVKDMGTKLNEQVRQNFDLLDWNKARKQAFKSLIK